MAPKTPDWIKLLGANGWVNIYDLVPDPRRLTGVDSFLGDWRAHTLVLGKDFAPARLVRKRLAAGDADPYRHEAKLPTNRMLHGVLRHIGVNATLDGARAISCGVFYGNAHFLLRDDDRFSGTLPNAKAALEQGQEGAPICARQPAEFGAHCRDGRGRLRRAVESAGFPWRLAPQP